MSKDLKQGLAIGIVFAGLIAMVSPIGAKANETSRSWGMYMVMMTATGPEPWFQAKYPSQEECESARNELVENLVFKIPGTTLQKVICKEEAPEAPSPWEKVSMITGAGL